MKEQTQITEKKITFNHTAPRTLATWRHSILWLIRIPAYDILFLGATGFLGALGLWIIERAIAPQKNSSQIVTVILDKENASLNELMLIGITAIFIVIFWVVAAYFTRRAVLWLA